MYHPSTTHNYCMIPPSVKKFNSNPSPISLLCLAVLTQTAYNLGQWGGGGTPIFFSKKTTTKRNLKFRTQKIPYICMKISEYTPPPLNESGSFRPRSSSPPRRFAPAAFRLRSIRPWSFRPRSRFAPGRFAPRRKINLFCRNLCE